jgi:uncharacterized protein (TIGR03083 family)
MVAISYPNAVQKAESIPAITEDEAYSLLTTALDRLLALLDTLEGNDWDQPTACTLWNVRDMVAHQAGGYASGTGYREMIRQYARIPRKGQLPEDAVNEFQLQERAGRTPDKLIQELREVGPVAARKWAYQFRLAKPFGIPHAVAGYMSLRYLMWVIHSRDTWMHRLDICRATGRKFEQTPEHDGRIVALIVQDTAKALQKYLDRQALVLDLTGTAGGTWKIGGGEPAATIRMDALDFAIFASGRFSRDEARALAGISGDADTASILFDRLLILF